MTPAHHAAAALVSIAEATCALAAQQRLDELAALAPEWNAAVAALPKPLPADVEPLVRRAHALQGQAIGLLEQAAGALASELAQVDRTRSGVRAYAPVTAPRGPAVDQAV
jgi:hypothetical protein